MAVAFAEPIALPAGDSPQGVVLADFNGDQKLDLAVAETGSNRVGIQLGRGDGTFGDATHVVAGAAPVELTAADFDGNGSADLAVTNFNGNNLSVLLGRGDGTFQPPTQYDTGGGPRTIASADFDHDDALDLIVGNQGNDLSLYHGRGDGTFDPKVDFGLQDQANGVAVADLNEDGAPDILAAGYFDLHLFLNDGSGQFPTRASFNSTGGAGFSVAAADVDGDGHLDAVRSNSANNFVSVYRGDGQGDLDGPFVYAVGDTPPYSSNGEYPYDVDFTDLDTDGHADLVIASNRGLVVRPGDGSGTFPDRLDFARGAGGVYQAIGDLDADGRPDVVLSDYGNDQLRVFLSRTSAPVFSIADTRIVEGDGGAIEAVFTVTLAEPMTAPLSLGYTTADGTAKAGDDYVAASGTLEFGPGQTVATISVPIIGDMLLEQDESFFVNLVPASGYLLADGRAEGTIADDERPSTIEFTAPSFMVTENGAFATVVVTRTEPASEGVSISFATADGTALAGRDYQPVVGTLTFAAGEASRTIAVPVTDDTAFRGDRTFRIDLGFPGGGAVVGDVRSASVTIREDEPGPAVIVRAVTPVVRRRALVAVVLGFSEPVDAVRAADLTNYRLVTRVRDRRGGLRDGAAIRIRSVSYDASSATVTLVIRGCQPARKVRRLTVFTTRPGGLIDQRGQPLDGDRDGVPGGDFVTDLGRPSQASQHRPQTGG